MKIDKIVTWIISIIIGVSTRNIQQSTNSSNASLIQPNSWLDATVAGEVTCYNTAIQSILTDSYIDYSLDMDLLQINNLNYYNENDCKYSSFIQLDIYPTQRPMVFDYFIIRQGIILKNLARIELLIDKKFTLREIKQSLVKKKHEIKNKRNRIEFNKLHIQNKKDGTNPPLYQIRNAILTANTIFKGVILQEHRNIESTIYTYSVYIKNNLNETKEAYNEIKNQYNAKNFEENSKITIDTTLDNFEHISAPKSLFHIRHLKFEYLLNHIFISLTQIKSFIIKHKSLLEIIDEWDDLNRYKSLIEMNLLPYEKLNYYAIVNNIPDIQKFLDNINKIYMKFQYAIFNINIKFEKHVLLIYELISKEPMPYDTSTSTKIQTYIDTALNEITEIESKHRCIKHIINVFNGIILKDELPKSIIKEVKENLENQFLKDLSGTKISNLRANTKKINSKIHEMEETMNKHKNINNPKTANVLKKLLETRILAEDSELVYSIGNDIELLMFNRYSVHSTKNYITCYNKLIQIINQYEKDENLGSPVYSLVKAPFAVGSANITSLKEEVKSKKNQLNNTIHVLIDMIFSMREDSYIMEQSNPSNSTNNKEKMYNSIETMLSALYIFDVYKNKSDIPWNMFEENKLFQPNSNMNADIFQEKVLKVADKLASYISNSTNISLDSVNSSLSICAQTSKQYGQLEKAENPQLNTSVSESTEGPKLSDELAYNNYFESLIKLFLTFDSDVKNMEIRLGMLHMNAPIIDPVFGSNLFPGSYMEIIKLHIKLIVQEYANICIRNEIISTISNICNLESLTNEEDSDFFEFSSEEESSSEELLLQRDKVDMLKLTIIEDNAKTYTENDSD
ncbi:hypothetical protein NEIRO02_1006 [Nematocida sp. AWRm79]|nr:hypothetical protein NEIRO02_1006 [Nematocida sp. AWRm79]